MAGRKAGIWAEVKAALGDIPHADDAATLKLKSRDFFWFSPILKPQLEHCRADLVVAPRNRDEVIRAASVAARLRVPITVRAGGTGNYGQAVPLEGGMLLDVSALDRTLWVKPGAGRFEAGARLLDMDRGLFAEGEEVRLYPSTRKQATIGGLIAGGAGGAGSCTWGQISDPGAVLALQVVTVEESPRIVELRGPDVLKVLHAYGVNGVITETEIPLAPRHDWAERIVAFPDLAAAARFGQAFTEADGIAKRLVSIHEPRIPAAIKRLKPYAPDGAAIAILMVSEPQAEACEAIAAVHGGTVTFRRTAEAARAAAFDGHGAIAPLYEYTWNHTTLHMLKVDPTITYLQLRFPPGRNLDLVAWVGERFRDEIWLHLEFQRRFGRVTNSALPIVKFTSPERLYAIVDELNANEVAVSDPHSYALDDAGWKRVDSGAAQFKSLADPHGLMNPGKLRAWPPAEAAE